MKKYSIVLLTFLAISFGVVIVNQLIRNVPGFQQEQQFEVDQYSCPETDGTGFVPCKVYVQFANDRLLQQNETNKAYVENILSKEKIEKYQIFEFIESNIIEVVITTKLGAEDIIGQTLKDKYSDTVIDYGRVLNFEKGE